MSAHRPFVMIVTCVRERERENGGFHGNECLDIVWDLWWTEWRWDSLFSCYFSFPVSAIRVISMEYNAFILRGSEILSSLLKTKVVHSLKHGKWITQ